MAPDIISPRLALSTFVASLNATAHKATVRQYVLSRGSSTYGFTHATGLIACEHGYSTFNLLTPDGYNPKTDKGHKRGYATAVLYLAPARNSGLNTCIDATPDCTAACLYTAGRGGFDPEVAAARLARTHFFFYHRSEFNSRLALEISAHQRKCERVSMACAVRLNGTSDFPWERLLLNNGRTPLETYPSVQFYDYTKTVARALAWASGEMPSNYHLTFSRAETARNQAAAAAVLAAGGNVAVVMRICGCGPLTSCKHSIVDGLQYDGRPVVNGDLDDLRFLDPPGVIVGLKAKGQARVEPLSGFVVDMRQAVAA